MQALCAATMEALNMAAPCAAVPTDNAASLAVVQKAGAKALSLDLPVHATQLPEGRLGPALTPMSTCDLQMSPTSPFSPGCFSFAGAGTAPMSCTSPAGGNFAVAAAPFVDSAVTAQLRGQMPFSPCQSPMTPGTEIRRNARSFGIPLSLEPRIGDVGVPIPVRTNSGMVYAPSPTTASSATFASGVSTAAAPLPSVGPGGVIDFSTVGPRPFVTPLSAGLRIARTGGVGGA